MPAKHEHGTLMPSGDRRERAKRCTAREGGGEEGTCTAAAIAAQPALFARRLPMRSASGTFPEALQSADKAHNRKNRSDIWKIRSDFCFLRQLHLHPAVTYVYVSSLGCKFAFLACGLFQRSDSLPTLSTSCPAGRVPAGQSADKAYNRKNCLDKNKEGGNFCFRRHPTCRLRSLTPM